MGIEIYNFAEVRNCYNETAADYSEKFCHELDDKPFDRDILRRFAKNVGENGKVFEFATGSGHIAHFLFNCGMQNIVGTDISEKAIELAKIKFAPIQFEVMNMLESGLPDHALDGIVCFYGIVHFAYQEIRTVLKEWNRILKKGGHALFSFHIGDDESVRVENVFNHEHVGATWNFFNVDKVVGLMTEMGIDYDEVMIRYPYLEKEHPSKRCYISFSKK